MTPIKLLRCPPYSGDCMGVNINASLQKNKLYRRFPAGMRRKSVGFIQHNPNCLFVFMLFTVNDPHIYRQIYHFSSKCQAQVLYFLANKLQY